VGPPSIFPYIRLLDHRHTLHRVNAINDSVKKNPLVGITNHAGVGSISCGILPL